MHGADDPNVLAQSVLWHALEKAGDKLKDQKIRKVLPAGGKIHVDLDVSGQVDGMPVATAVDGYLQIAHDGTTTAKEKPDPAVLVALVLAAAPKTRRDTTLANLVDRFRSEGELPAPDAELLALAQETLDALTPVVSKPRSGTVSFEFAA